MKIDWIRLKTFVLNLSTVLGFVIGSIGTYFTVFIVAKRIYDIPIASDMTKSQYYIQLSEYGPYLLNETKDVTFSVQSNYSSMNLEDVELRWLIHPDDNDVALLIPKNYDLMKLLDSVELAKLKEDIKFQTTIRDHRLKIRGVKLGNFRLILSAYNQKNECLVSQIYNLTVKDKDKPSNQ